MNVKHTKFNEPIIVRRKWKTDDDSEQIAIRTSSFAPGWPTPASWCRIDILNSFLFIMMFILFGIPSGDRKAHGLLIGLTFTPPLWVNVAMAAVAAWAMRRHNLRTIYEYACWNAVTLVGGAWMIVRAAVLADKFTSGR